MLLVVSSPLDSCLLIRSWSFPSFYFLSRKFGHSSYFLGIYSWLYLKAEVSELILENKKESRDVRKQKSHFFSSPCFHQLFQIHLCIQAHYGMLLISALSRQRPQNQGFRIILSYKVNWGLVSKTHTKQVDSIWGMTLELILWFLYLACTCTHEPIYTGTHKHTHKKLISLNQQFSTCRLHPFWGVRVMY